MMGYTTYDMAMQVMKVAIMMQTGYWGMYIIYIICDVGTKSN